MTKKIPKIYKSIDKVKETILNGTMLAIDPSTGSQSSQPGYAWFEAGELTESGLLYVDPALGKSERLYEISTTLREEFDTPDILAVEYIPPVSYKGGMSNISIMALQKAIGAILASHPISKECLIEMPAITWKRFKPEDYEKTDVWDSIVIGLATVGIAMELNNKGK